jgi:hypothetical protein
MKIKRYLNGMPLATSELSGAALDWAVAKCEGVAVSKFPESNSLFFGSGFDKWSPSTDWSQGGPIIEREKITIRASFGNPVRWVANTQDMKIHYYIDAPCPLVAAMRCYVASKLGEDVSVPEELMKGNK